MTLKPRFKKKIIKINEPPTNIGKYKTEGSNYYAKN